MKLIIFTILTLLLSVASASGQRNGSACENQSEKFQHYMRPDLKDSLTCIMDALDHRLDSLHIHRYFDRRALPRNPYSQRPHFNENDMVFNPGPSNDRMPNANVTTPGVHYTIKIVPPGGYYLKRYRFNQPYFHR
jgi:hypothetical protein